MKNLKKTTLLALILSVWLVGCASIPVYDDNDNRIGELHIWIWGDDN